ncbi:unnamed protein product, partial [Rotaria socialis]
MYTGQRLLLISFSFTIALAAIEFLAVRLPLRGKPSPPNAVWPHPQQITISNDVLYIRPHDLKIDSNIRSCDIIAKAIQRYEPIFFPPKLAMNLPPSSANNILQSLT